MKPDEPVDDTAPIELRSQKHFEILYWAFMVANATGVYLCLCVAVYLLSHSWEEDIAKGTAVLVLGSAAGLLVYLFTWVYLRPRAFLSAQLHSGHLLIDRDGHQTRAEYREITAISFPRLSLFGTRLMLQLQDGTKIRLPKTLIGLSRLVDVLEKFDPQRFVPQASLRFRKSAKLEEFKGSRSTQSFAAGGQLLIKYILFPGAIGVLIPNCVKALIDKNMYYLMWRFPSRYVTIHIIVACALALVMGLLLKLLREFLTRRREQPIGLIDLERDLVFEKKLHKTFNIIYYVSMLVLYATNFIVFTLDF